MPTTRTTTAHGRRSTLASGLDRFRDDVLHGLSASRKAIPCKYLYDERGSWLFDRICELDEYYLTRTELAILSRCAGEMAEAIGPDCELVELGSGSAVKTRLLLEQLHDPRAYIPIDISPDPLHRSAVELGAMFPGLEIIPICDDFTESFDLPDSGTPPALRRVVYFPGSTIGNFQPLRALRLLTSIARLVGLGGGLLIGFDLDKDESIVGPAYNDRHGISAAFNLNLLVRMNRELGAGFDLDAFEHRASYLRQQQRVELGVVSRIDQVARVAGREFRFARGELIHTEDSYKYTREHFARLTARAGFALEAEWTDEREYFCVQLLTVE